MGSRDTTHDAMARSLGPVNQVSAHGWSLSFLCCGANGPVHWAILFVWPIAVAGTPVWALRVNPGVLAFTAQVVPIGVAFAVRIHGGARQKVRTDRVGVADTGVSKDVLQTQ